jgi:hypothetical protein
VVKHSTRKVTATLIRNAKRLAKNLSLNLPQHLLVRMQVPDELLCPITLMPMKDPVIASDGRTYERAAITEWLANHSTSPLTREPMSVSTLKSNYAVKSMLSRYNSMTIVPIQPPIQSQSQSANTNYQSLPSAPIVVVDQSQQQPTRQRQAKVLQLLCIGLTCVILIIIIAKLVANS